MAKKYDTRKIISKRSYSTEEIATALGVHVQTVRSWRKQGMKPIEASTSPFLYIGSEIRAFLQRIQDKKKVKLKDDELYCVSCRKGVTPKQILTKDRNITIGKGKKSIFLYGTCPECGKEARRFATKEQIENKPKVETSPKLPKAKNVQKGQMSLFD